METRIDQADQGSPSAKRSVSKPRGQTMTEYVLILAAIAVAGYTAYVGLEGGINGLITSVVTTLSAA